MAGVLPRQVWGSGFELPTLHKSNSSSKEQGCNYQRREATHLGLVQKSIHSEDVGVWMHHDSLGRHLCQVAGLELAYFSPCPIGAQQLIVLRPEVSSPGFRIVA